MDELIVFGATSQAISERKRSKGHNWLPVSLTFLTSTVVITKLTKMYSITLEQGWAGSSPPRDPIQPMAGP